MNPIKLAAGAKGQSALLNRIGMITKRYGLTPAKMQRALDQFVKTLRQFDCGATFPATAATVERHPAVLEKYQTQDIEFAVHGYTHVDYSQLAPEEQLTHLHRAREVFAAAGITAVGFRSPYLRQSNHLYAAIEAEGFSYVSNQPILWNVLDIDGLTPTGQAGYQRAIDFYAPWEASKRLSLPQLYNQLVEIPVSLPDDEILIDRLGGNTDSITKTWQSILSQAHQQGELFTLQLHPERIARCADGLSAVLSEARTLRPSVWIARLDEIAAWWRARAAATVEITSSGEGKWHVAVDGPRGATVLARQVQIDTSTTPWADGYRQVNGTTFNVRSPLQPCIGISPGATPELASFLRQQGYIVETGVENRRYSYYFDRAEFAAEQERTLLAQIEETDFPLVRLSRWPNGARSALSITGDIDALTLWDYGLRLFGK
ncbi:MAG: hypothetical protein DRJ03_21135 [Chloroflexi bacterium]|nr:MAG: hypothetical protein DRJ03_21135 [Chloroflexota bacterium]RLC81385.1 MAG: hypothetical protein DRI81_02515 [Chloroflexota bacterium]